MRRTVWMSAVVALGIAAASTPVRAREGQPCTPAAAAFDIAGSWVGNSPAIPGFYAIPLVSIESVTATDPTGQTYTSVPQPVNGDATFGGIFPDADQIAPGVGTYRRSGPRAYEFTWMDHFVKSPQPGVFDRGEILYFWTLSGTAELLDANTRSLTGMLSFFSNVNRPDLVVPPLGINGVHDQDVNDDGFADEGEAPFVALPFDFTFKRFPAIVPCPPPAP